MKVSQLIKKNIDTIPQDDGRLYMKVIKRANEREGAATGLFKFPHFLVCRSPSLTVQRFLTVLQQCL